MAKQKMRFWQKLRKWDWFSAIMQITANKQHEAANRMSFNWAETQFIATLSGALYWPDEKSLLVADLHLEKGSSYARAGQFLPPYDSVQTLGQLKADIEAFDPDHILCLGDSFHDREAAKRLPANCRAMLTDMMQNRQWTWIAGNHDPFAPSHLGGQAATRQEIGTIGLCHEPGELRNPAGEPQSTQNVRFEISGHLHPVARIRNKVRGRALRRSCFVIANNHLIMPAYGAYTGGLDIQDEAFAAFVDVNTRLIVRGRTQLSQHAFKML